MLAADIQQDKDVALLLDIGKKAGEIAMSYFGNNPKYWFKNNTSSVSEADMAVDTFLKSELLNARPDYGWLSEETTDNDHRLTQKTIFIVDPIDGTKAFLKGEPDWCIALAIVEDGSPRVAALIAPALQKNYVALRDAGAFCNEQKLQVSRNHFIPDLLVASPPAHGPWEALQSSRRAAFVPSLALRLARVASGELDAAFAKPNACDWDIASAHLIIEEAGGCLIDFDGVAPRYNRADVHHNALAALSPQLKNLSR